jgi:hypothetical protein
MKDGSTKSSESSAAGGPRGPNEPGVEKPTNSVSATDTTGTAGTTRRATARKVSFGATVKAVFWSFFGVRKKSDYERDAAQLNPVHVVIAGLIGALLFIGLLVTVVRIVVAK